MDPLSAAEKYTPRVASTWLGLLDSLPAYNEWLRLAQSQNDGDMLTKADFNAIAEMGSDEYDLFLDMRRDLMPDDDG